MECCVNIKRGKGRHLVLTLWARNKRENICAISFENGADILC